MAPTMTVMKLAAGLWRWTAPLPTGALVASVYCEAAGCIVLVDPVVPEGPDRERLWRALDRDAARMEAMVVLLTRGRHRRGADLVGERYGAPVVSPPEPTEVAVHLPSHGALVVGGVLRGLGGGLRLDPGYRGCREDLRRLLALEADIVLPSHGEPVLAGGKAALEAALTPAAQDV